MLPENPRVFHCFRPHTYPYKLKEAGKCRFFMVDLERLVEVVAWLNRRWQWNLSDFEVSEYGEALSRYAPYAYDNDGLEKIVRNYHLDHALVQKFAGRGPLVDDTWKDWEARVYGILRYSGLEYSGDSAVTRDDFVQIALEALIKSIPSFHYESRFLTWTYAVVVRAVNRCIRDSKAMKRRPPNVLSVERDNVESLVWDEIAFEVDVEGQELYHLIDRILAEKADSRSRRIFYLWTIEDLHVEEIAAEVGLSAPRVRSLLWRVRWIVRDHPDIHAWKRSMDEFVEQGQVVE